MIWAHIFTKLLHPSVLFGIGFLLLAKVSPVSALTVVKLENGNRNAFYYNSDEQPCFNLSDNRKLQIGTHLHRGQGICVKGKARILILCDRSSSISPLKRNSLVEGEKYQVSELCPQDPGPLLYEPPKIQEGGFDEGLPYIIGPRYTLLRKHDDRPTFRWYDVEGVDRYQVVLCKWGIEGQGEILWSKRWARNSLLATKRMKVFSNAKNINVNEFPYPKDQLSINETVEQGITYSLILIALDTKNSKPENLLEFEKNDCRGLVNFLRETQYLNSYLEENEPFLGSLLEENRINLSEYKPRTKKMQEGVWKLEFGLLSSKTDSFAAEVEKELPDLSLESLESKLINYYKRFNLYSEGISFFETLVSHEEITALNESSATKDFLDPETYIFSYIFLGDLYAETGLSDLSRASYITAIYKLKGKPHRSRSKILNTHNSRLELIATAQGRLCKLYKKIGKKAGWDEASLSRIFIQKMSTKDCR